MEIKNKIVLITGATRGIGLSLATRLENQGAIVILTGRNQERLKIIQQKNLKFDTQVLDVLSSSSIENLSRYLKNKYGRVDILINNAAVLFSGDFITSNYTDEQIDSEVLTNIAAPIKLIRSYLSLMSASNDAAIVNITSAVAYLPMKSLPVYSATKSALHSFTVSLRESLKETNIKVLEVLPPLVATNMTEDLPGKAKDLEMLTPEKCSEIIIKGIKNNRKTMHIGNSTKGLFWGSKFFPKLVLKNLNKL